MAGSPHSSAPGGPTPLARTDLATRDERARRGKELRKRTPREAHAGEGKLRGRDAVAILAQGDLFRIQDLVPERYRRMRQDPFAFLRGAASVMAHDLASEPAAGAMVQACGDCHLMNFGAFATPEDNILFDINDFDETLPGVDFTVDVKRLAASVAVAALTAGRSRGRSRGLAKASIAAYRRRMIDLSPLSPLAIWHSRVELEAEVKTFADRGLREKMRDVIAKARSGGLSTDDNFPHLVGAGPPRIADRPPTIVHPSEQSDPGKGIDEQRVFAHYAAILSPERLCLVERYRMVDFAFKAVGVGSVGTYCAIALFMTADGEPLFLQLKEARPSVLAEFGLGRSDAGHQGQRVVEGQRMLQAASDLFLGWASDPASGRSFYVRALKNRRLGSVTELGAEEGLDDYACLCGRTLARAHARSGDACLIAGYLGRGDVFEEAVSEFALAYADQTLADHAALVAAGAGGRAARRHP